MIAKHSQLDFPWDEVPATGAVREVAPGLWWACLPLPFRLNHVNVWLIEEEGGWTVIDTGCATPEIISAWEELLAGPMRGLPVHRVVATHGHVDHVGLAGWMVERFDADFVTTFGEWNWARLIHMRGVPGAEATHRSHLIRHGIEAEVAGTMVRGRERVAALSTPIPAFISEIRDGGTLRMGGREWEVIVTRGHAYEHASFFDRAGGVLIAGDHILPRISPMIAVAETMPNGNPLGDYLSSFDRFSGIPSDVLVLPSHGLPYRGIHERVGELRDHHRRRLDETVDFLRMPRTAHDLARVMFPHASAPDQAGFALGETLAHVNYLLHQGLLDEACDSDGHLVYVARA